jgi:hypothetical protein
MTTQQAISNTIPVITPIGPTDKGGSSRQPMYPGNETRSHKGLKKARRTVTSG